MLIGRSKAQDPDIRRVAEEAETRLVRDPYSKYSPWPSPPPSTGPPPPTSAYAHTHYQPPLIQQPVADLVTPSPSTVVEHAVSASPRDHGTPSSATTATTYASPYGSQSVVQNAVSQAPAGPAKFLQLAPINNAHVNHANGHPSPPHQTDIPCDPALQDPSSKPLAPAQPILSRTRETKILLSIDGDGIRGLSALLLVESLVNAICVKVGQRLDSHQIFDLTGGCSLGGIIAIMLCRLRMQAHRAREAYKQIAKEVFANKRDYFKYLDPHAQVRSVDDSALENAIKSVVQQELGNPDEILLDGRPDSGDV
jgi:hypothetical protein